jgi:hypothetical protein
MQPWFCRFTLHRKDSLEEAIDLSRDRQILD